MDWHSIWRGLSKVNRIAAAGAFWDREQDTTLHGFAYEELAKSGGFRVQTLRKMSKAKLAELTGTARTLHELTIREAIRAFYTGPRLDCLSTLLDALGIGHENGALDEDPESIPEVETEALREAIDVTEAAHGAELALTLVRALYLLYPILYAQLPNALSLREEEQDAAAAGAPPPEEVEGGDSASLHPEAQDAGFTTLDREIIKAVVSSVTTIEGALDQDQVRDLVDEVLALNVTRHRSYFHLGFLDGLVGSEITTDFPGANEDRRAWYLAGATTALARHGDQQGLLQLLDGHTPTFHSILSGRHDAVTYVLPLMADAMWASGREAELAHLSSAAAWGVQTLSTLRRQLDRVAGLLIDQEPERAEPHLEILESCLHWRSQRGLEVPGTLLHTVLRRRAHALRQRGDFQRARQRLERLEELGTKWVRAQVCADLGLVDAGYRSLSRIRFPDKQQDLGDLATSLEKGRERFERSVEMVPARGGHGAYCLALLATARGDQAEALRWAQQAEAFFAADPGIYERGHLLARARLMLGWAYALNLDVPRTGKAVEAISYATSRLGLEAQYLVEDALRHLAEMDAEQAAKLVTELMGIAREKSLPADGILDAATAPETLRHSAELREVALEEATRGGVPWKRRFAYARRLLAVAEMLRNIGLADKALDVMQGIARSHHGSDEAGELIGLLTDSDSYATTVWEAVDIRDALLLLYRKRGETRRAANLLEEGVHDLLTEGTPWAVDDAADLVEELRELGVEGFPTETALTRLDAGRGGATGSEERPASIDRGVRGKILFLGGAEIQAQYDKAIEARFRELYPRVEIEFQHLGWSSNWGRELEKLEGSLQRADALVMMRFMRTMCGRALRKKASELGIPWVSCTGHGRASIERAIQRAVEVIRDGQA